MQKFSIKTLVALLMLNMIVASQALAATSSVTVTSTPFLAFNDVPDSFVIDSIQVPTADIEITSDVNGQLGAARYLQVRDTRGCGGFSLTLGADTFTPATSPELRDNLRIVTNEDDAATGTSNAGIKYLTGFTGDQNVAAPLDVTATTYSSPNLFTAAPFDVTDNILDAPLTIMDGGLAAPTGRDGTIHTGVSFYMQVPKFFPPSSNNYYTTLTYTLTDDTSGSC